jgi:hypothetical protein
MEATPVVSSINLIFDPDLPIIMPQLEIGTSNLTTKSKDGDIPWYEAI